MKYRSLFDGTKIPLIGLGTWGVGGKYERDERNDSESLGAIQDALNIGYTHIDTAELYGAGHTEELVGKAIKGIPREKLFITTKLWPEHAEYSATKKAIEGSLSRLQLSYIDLYLIHYPNPQVPLSETFRALNEIVEEGKARYLGVSNFSVEEMEKAQKLSKTHIVTNQVYYNLKVREPEENGVLEYCRKNNALVTAYRPIEKGEILSMPSVQALAKKYGKTPSQIALNWLISDPAVITICKASSKEHLKENFESASFSLSKEDREALSSSVSFRT